MQDIVGQVKRYLEMEKEGGVSEFLFSSKGKATKLSLLKNKTIGCQRCQLAHSRRNVVFGEGSIDAKLVFVGEAPGREEDKQGRPFVGEAGMLLSKIIEAMGLKRQDVYICNILKCRPPQNRNPIPEEISQCIEHLYSQIELLRPKVICGLGKFASQTLLDIKTPITRLRGNWHEFKGIDFMPTYHPAYLLRNPHDKKLVWQDMKKIMEKL